MTLGTEPQSMDVYGDEAGDPNRSRRWIWILVSVIVLAALTSTILWWQVTARTYALTTTGPYTASGTSLQAGSAVEHCTPARPGATVEYSFAIANHGGHGVTLTSVEPILEPWAQTVSVGSQAQHPSSADDVDPLPITIAARSDRSISLRLRLSEVYPLPDREHVFTDHVVVHFRVLGVSRTQELPLGGPAAPQYVGLEAPDSTGKACGS